MINPTKKIKMATTQYLPQFRSSTYEYHNYDFYTTTVGFKEMYVKKYDWKRYQFSLHPFKVVILQ